MSLLEAIYEKLKGDPSINLEPFPFQSLPNDRNDLLWETIRTNYHLSLVELSSLKNSLFDQPPAIQPQLQPAQLQPPPPPSELHFGPFVDDRKNKKRSRPRKEDVDEDGERKKPRTKTEMLQQNFDRIKDALLKFKELKGHMLVPYEFRIPANDPNWKEDQGDLWLGRSIISFLITFMNYCIPVHITRKVYRSLLRSHPFSPFIPTPYLIGKVCRNIRAGHCYGRWKEELIQLGFDYTKQSKGDWSR